MSRPPADEWSRQDHASDWLHDDVDAHDPSLADDVLHTEPGHTYHDEEPPPTRRAARPRKKRSPARTWVAVFVALAVVVGGGYVALQVVSGLIPSISFGGGGTEPDDYPGPGTGQVDIEVPSGAGGFQIGEILADADVVASASAFAATAAADARSTSIQPGTYRMALQMSSAGALERLLDSSYRQVQGVTVREGLWTNEVFAVLAEATGNEVADYQAIDPEDLDLPAAANGDLQGYLFPDTYQFGPSTTPEQQLQTMVDMAKQRYADLGLTDDDMERTIIVASIIEGEAAFPDDLPRVARVIENRLADSEPLGMDSTIHFIHQERGRAGTTDAQRAEQSPYNTYLNAGLPPGPINNPGAAAIQAAMNPADGDWKYFVTVNPDTGETLFAETFSEHLRNAEQFEQWCRDNRDRC